MESNKEGQLGSFKLLEVVSTPLMNFVIYFSRRKLRYSSQPHIHVRIMGFVRGQIEQLVEQPEPYSM